MKLPYRVMVVEDEPVVAVGVVAMIQEAGHEVVGVARSGEEALDMAADNDVSMALVDVKLPGINGVETTRQLVEKYNIAVIILTAYADPEFVEGAAAAGAYTYLLKPVAKENAAAQPRNGRGARERAQRAAERSARPQDVT